MAECCIECVSWQGSGRCQIRRPTELLDAGVPMGKHRCTTVSSFAALVASLAFAKAFDPALARALLALGSAASSSDDEDDDELLLSSSAYSKCGADRPAALSIMPNPKELHIIVCT